MAKYGHTAWIPPSLPETIVLLGGSNGDATLLTAEIVPGIIKFKENRSKLTLSGGRPSFDLAHAGTDACGIPDGESFVLTGGHQHNYVTRCRYQRLFLLQSSSLSFVSDEIIIIIVIHCYHHHQYCNQITATPPFKKIELGTQKRIWENYISVQDSPRLGEKK